MAVTVTRVQPRVLSTDSDVDGQPDPGDVIFHRIIIRNDGTAKTNVTLDDTENGYDIIAASVKIGPIAVDDAFSISGNTPYTFSIASLTGNDIDPDDVTPVFTFSLGTATNGTIVNNGNGTLTFTPATGLDAGATASFTYSILDEQGISSVSDTPGIVTFTISDVVWYVDSAYAGGDSDGSYLKPFTTLAKVNGDSNDATIDDDVDSAGETIFIYNRGGNYLVGGNGLALENSQTLRGDGGPDFTVNGLAIGASSSNTLLLGSSGIAYGVVLASDNVIRGVTIEGQSATSVNLADGNGIGDLGGSVGNLVISNSSIIGLGQAVDIDEGGNLNVVLDVLSSSGTGTNMQGVQLAGTASSGAGLIQGSFTALAGTIQTASSHNFQIGTGGGAFGGGTIAVDYDGTLNTSLNGSAVHISGRLAGAGDIRFDGNIFQDSGASSSSDGIAITNVAAGNIFFTGTKTIDTIGSNLNAISVTANSGAVINFSGGALNLDTGAGHGFAISQSGGQVNVSTAADIDTTSGRGISISNSTGGSVNFTGGGLTITTTTGTALFDSNATAGSSLTILGSGNTLQTTGGGSLVFIANSGTSGIIFDTMTADASVAGGGIVVFNLDGGAWTTNTITIAGTTGAGNDGIFLGSGSSSAFNLGAVTIGSTGDDGLQLNDANGAVTASSLTISNSADDGVILNGTNGAVTFTTVNINGSGGQGIEIVGATSAVNINGGTIGNTDDPALEAVLISSGTGAVTIAASITKTTPGNVVEIQNHSGGTITFSGAISATGVGGATGLLINNNSGDILFTNSSKTFTSAFTTIEITNNAANVKFQNGGLAINATGGASGFSATGSGTVEISGTNNIISSQVGHAVKIDGPDIAAAGITLQSVSSTVSSGGNQTGIYLKNTGTGAFTVTGTGTTDGSGGTISGKTIGNDGETTNGIGVYLENTGPVSLSNMVFGASGQTMQNFGIRGFNVGGFTLANADFRGTFGTNASIDSYGEGAVYFGSATVNGVTGDVNITDSTIQGAFGRNLSIVNISGSMDLTVTGNTFGPNSATSTGSNLEVESRGTSQMDVLVSGNTFSNSPGDQIGIVNQVGTGTANVTISGNTLSNNHANNIIGGGGITVASAAAMVFSIVNNTINGADGDAISLQMAAPAGGDPGARSFQGTVANNQIGTAGVGSGSKSANGVFLSLADNQTNPKGVATIAITNNLIQNYSGNAGIYADNTGGNYDLNLTITGNTVVSTAPTVLYGIAVTAGAPGTSDDIDVFLKLSGNDVDQGDPNNLFDIILGVSGSNSSMRLSGATSADVQTTTAIENFIKNTNNLNGAAAGTVVDAYSDIDTNSPTPPVEGFIADGGSPPLPAAPALPIIAEAPAAIASPQPAGDPEPAADEPAAEPQPAGDPEPVADEDISVTPQPVGDPIAADDESPIVDDGVLSQAELDFLVEAAIERWGDAGASEAQLAAMRATQISVADMAGLYLGLSNPGSIRVDSDGAGHGWFLDHTPGEDGEYDGAGSRLVADAGGPAEARMDLLTVLMHELGHQAGLEDLYAAASADELMYYQARLGERRLPMADDLAGADDMHAGHESFVLSTVVIPSLPANKGVEVQFNSTVDSFSNQVIPNPFSNTSTVTWDGGGPVSSTAEALVIDSLTLGNLVFRDADNSGTFNAGDTGIADVQLYLYADSGALVGELDAGDTLLSGTITAADGAYSFANLAPGNYLVLVDPGEFGAGGQLVGLATGSGSADPDDNVDNDDNGVPAGNTIGSKAITLAYNTEPTAGTGNDTNNTLDFGFVQPNQPPTSTNLSGDTVTWTEGDSTVRLDLLGNADIGDPDSTDFDGGSLRVALTGSVPAQDGLFINTLGGITSNAGTVSFNGTQFATFVGGGFGGGDLVFAFDADATHAAVEGLIHAIAYSNNGGDDPTDGNRTVTWTLKDGDGTADGGSDTLVVTTTVDVDPVNDAPGGTDKTVTASEDDPYTFTAADFGFTDPLDGDALLSVLIATAPTNGLLKNGATTLGAGSEVSLADINAGNLKFHPDLDETGSPYATFTFRVRDDGGTADGGINLDPVANTMTVNVTPDNLAPVVDLNGGDAGVNNAAAYSEQAAPTILSSIATVTDADGTQISGATVSIGAGFVAFQDFLTVNGATGGTAGAIGFGYNAATGVLTLTGTATLAEYQAVLRQIGFESTSDTPGTSRTIAWAVTDALGGVGNATTTVTVTPVNDPPVNTVPGPQTGTEDTDLVFSTANGNAISVADADHASLTVILSVDNGKLTLSTLAGLTFSAGDGTGDAAMTFSGTIGAINAALNGLVYRGNLNYEGSDSLFFKTSDGSFHHVNTVAITLADDGVIHGDAGNNTLSGTPNADTFDVSQGGNDTVSGLGGDDFFYFGDALTAADAVDGGAGYDKVGLRGDYSLTLGATTLIAVEELLLLSGVGAPSGDGEFDYSLTLHDGNVAAGQQLRILGDGLAANENLVVNGLAETNGVLRIRGGAGDDSLAGGQQGDHLFGNGGNDFIYGAAGDDRITGGMGKDSLNGGTGRDAFLYASAAESTSAGYDVIGDFQSFHDRIDLPVAVSGWAAGVNSGQLRSGANFDADLAAAVNASLGANQAIRFSTTSGDLAGRTFVVVDANGNGDYDAGTDFVFEFQNPIGPLDGGTFFV